MLFIAACYQGSGRRYDAGDAAVDSVETWDAGDTAVDSVETWDATPDAGDEDVGDPSLEPTPDTAGDPLPEGPCTYPGGPYGFSAVGDTVPRAAAA